MDRTGVNERGENLDWKTKNKKRKNRLDRTSVNEKI